jgi:hypothetical protein
MWSGECIPEPHTRNLPHQHAAINQELDRNTWGVFLLEFPGTAGARYIKQGQRELSTALSAQALQAVSQCIAINADLPVKRSARNAWFNAHQSKYLIVPHCRRDKIALASLEAPWLPDYLSLKLNVACRAAPGA